MFNSSRRSSRALRFFLVFLVALLAHPASATPENHAKRWLGWSAESRLAYVEGLVSGSFGAYAGTIVFLFGPEEAKKKILSAEHLVQRKEFVIDTLPDMLVPRITQFYENPKHAIIPMSDAALIVQKQLGGGDATKDIEHILKVVTDVDAELNPPKK